jgi:asparagine synthetase B (glutamine-hydrolysing)
METGNGHFLEAFTLGHERSREVMIGREIAGLAGLPHSMIPANPGYISDYAERCVTLTEGNMNIHAAWILGVEEHLQTHPTSAVITGVGGEGISGRHMLAELANPNLEQALNWLSTQHFRYPQAEELLRPELLPALAESRAWLKDIVAQAPGSHPLARYDFYYYRQMRRHPTGSVLANATQVIEPYFDNDLVDFALSLPPEMRACGRLFKGLLQQHFPELAAVGGTGSLAGGSSQTPSVLRRLDALVRQMHRRVNRYLLFFNPSLTGDRPDSAIYYNHWLRNAARPFVTRLLQREDLLGDYLDMRAVQALVDSHMSGRRNAFRTLGALATFALWRRQFT